MAGPAMPIFVFSVAIITSQHPSNAAFPAKQYPDAIPIVGLNPESWANNANAMVSSPATPGESVSPGRPPPPSANKTTGNCRSWAIVKSRSFLR